MTEYAHIAPQFHAIMEASDLERIQFMDQARWVDYKAGNKLLDILSGLMLKPPRARMANLLIVGDSNSGKTTLINRFKFLCGEAYVDDKGNSIRPLVMAEISKADEGALYNAILDDLFSPHNPSAPVAKLRHQAIHLIRESKARMLIIDEIQTLNAGSAIKKHNVMNEIKMLCNVLQIPIVCLGTRTALQLLHLDPQYASRFEVIPLPNWAPDPDFQRFLKSFESILPLKKPSRLYSPELTTLIHAISDGVTGNVEYLLTECAKEAIQTGVEVIDRQLLEKNKWMRPTDGPRVRNL